MPKTMHERPKLGERYRYMARIGSFRDLNHKFQACRVLRFDPRDKEMCVVIFDDAYITDAFYSYELEPLQPDKVTP